MILDQHSCTAATILVLWDCPTSILNMTCMCDRNSVSQHVCVQVFTKNHRLCIHLYIFLVIENLTSTSLKGVRCSSGVLLRGWRAWNLNKLPSPSWASSRGEHSHNMMFNLDQL